MLRSLGPWVSDCGALEYAGRGHATRVHADVARRQFLPVVRGLQPHAPWCFASPWCHVSDQASLLVAAASLVGCLDADSRGALVEIAIADTASRAVASVPETAEPTSVAPDTGEFCHATKPHTAEATVLSRCAVKVVK